jgi:hypothetical protein
MTMRVLVAAVVRPSESVAPEAAWYADTIVGQFAGTASAVGGFLAAAAGAGLEPLPLGVTATDTVGAISREALDTLRTRLFSELRGWEVDAVYIAFPGETPIQELDEGRKTKDESPSAQFVLRPSSFVPQATPQSSDETVYAEADLAAVMRHRLGPDVPIVVAAESEPPPEVVDAWAKDGVIGLTPRALADSSARALGEAAAWRLRELLAPGATVHVPVATPRPIGTVGLVAPGPGAAEGPSLAIVLPADPAPAAAAGEVVPLALSVGGLAGRRLSVGWFVCDEWGHVRWDTRVEREVDSDPAVLEFAWPVRPADPPGTYSLRAMAWSPEDRWQGIASGTMEVVEPSTGRRARAARFPALPWETLLAPRGTFEAVERAWLEALFRESEAACLAAHHPDGSWGSPSLDRRGPKHIAIYTRTAENAMAYLYAYQLFGDAAYAAEAERGLDFLVREQLENGGWCPWSFTWVTPQWVFLREACFYDTGGVARVLLEGHTTLGHRRYLEAVRRAADYALTAPYTGNNNYDAFLLWYLAPYARLTGEIRYVEHAVARCREAVLPGQQPYGGFPAHNLSTGYQAIIAYGLLALHGALPAEHWYAGPLRRATLLALNFLLWLQDERGRFHAGWEYDRTFGPGEDGRPRGSTTSPANGRLVEVFRSAAEQFPARSADGGDVHDHIYRSLCHTVAARAADPARHADFLAITSLLRWPRGD